MSRIVMLFAFAAFVVAFAGTQGVLAQAPAPGISATAPEMAQRGLFGGSALKFAFSTSNSGATNTGAGSVIPMDLSTDPVLATLPNNGVAQNVDVYHACTINVPHVHPRGNEIYFSLNGPLSVGIAQEGMAGSGIINLNISAGQNVVVPQGLPHFVQNTGCSDVNLIQFFDNRDAGTVILYANLLAFPDTAVQAFTGLDAATIAGGRTATPGNGALAQDPNCLKRCGLSPGASVPAPAVSG